MDIFMAELIRMLGPGRSRKKDRVLEEQLRDRLKADPANPNCLRSVRDV